MKSTHATLYILFNIFVAYFNIKYNVVLDNVNSFMALSFVYLTGIAWIILADLSTKKGDVKSVIFCAVMSLTNIALTLITVMLAI